MKIKLLCEAVARFTGNSLTCLAHEPLLNISQVQHLQAPSQPPKVPWKKVSQYIWGHGGSYQFGNATCKKKWCEIHGIKL